MDSNLVMLVDAKLLGTTQLEEALISIGPVYLQ